MSKIKIMQVIYILKAGAGIENLVLCLSSHFNNDIFETYVVGFKSGSLINNLSNKGVRCFSLNKKTGFDLKFITRFNHLIKSIKPHIIHAHSLSPNFWSLVLGKHFHKTKNISTVHTVIKNRAVYKPFYNYVNLFSDKIIAVSEKVKSAYADTSKIDPSKIEVIYNGTSLPKNRLQNDKLLRLRKDLKLNPKLKTVISVGRLEEPKGYTYLIQAAYLLFKKGVHLNFMIVGDGYLKNDLIMTTRKLGLEKYFIFTGYRSDISVLIQASDFAIMPSIREGFSVALLEFMAMGMPLVITDVGGNREAITHGASGIIVPPGNSQALAEGIERIFNEPKLANSLGAEAQQTYEKNFTAEKMVKHYEQLYLRLVK